MRDTLEDVRVWHEAGKLTSPRARSVRYTQVLLDEIARLREDLDDARAMLLHPRSGSTH